MRAATLLEWAFVDVLFGNFMTNLTRSNASRNPLFLQVFSFFSQFFFQWANWLCVCVCVSVRVCVCMCVYVCVCVRERGLSGIFHHERGKMSASESSVHPVINRRDHHWCLFYDTQVKKNPIHLVFCTLSAVLTLLWIILLKVLCSHVILMYHLIHVIHFYELYHISFHIWHVLVIITIIIIFVIQMQYHLQYLPYQYFLSIAH